MFGTMSHFRVKPGHEEALRALQEEWEQTMRPSLAIRPSAVARSSRAWGASSNTPILMLLILLRDNDGLRQDRPAAGPALRIIAVADDLT